MAHFKYIWFFFCCFVSLFVCSNVNDRETGLLFVQIIEIISGIFIFGCVVMKCMLGYKLWLRMRQQFVESETQKNLKKILLFDLGAAWKYLVILQSESKILNFKMANDLANFANMFENQKYVGQIWEVLFEFTVIRFFERWPSGQTFIWKVYSIIQENYRLNVSEWLQRQ